jgi:putative RecB family exonuclease
MATFSHSKINTYENCPYQYKLKYIDKVPVDIPNTIECFMGDLVHRTLEELYKQIMGEKLPKIDELIMKYNQMWQEEYTEDILIVKENQGYDSEHYKKLGEKFIINYFFKYHPFDKIKIIGIETQDMMELPDGNMWHIRIDKLGHDEEGNYFVMDYKTSARMKNQKEADEDRQLGMYGLWVKKNYPLAKNIYLKWHMLAHNQEVISVRTEDQFNSLIDEVIAKIASVEKSVQEGYFPKKRSALCNYCLYKNICKPPWLQ